MATEIKVPSPGESINEVQLANWLVEDGSYVDKDQEIAEIDSDKATLSISAEEAGIIHFKAEEGDTIEVGTVVAVIEEAEAPADRKEKKSKAAEEKPTEESQQQEEKAAEDSKKETEQSTSKKAAESGEPSPNEGLLKLSPPLARKIMQAEQIDEKELLNFFKQFRVEAKDVNFFKENQNELKSQPKAETSSWGGGSREQNKKKMSMLRKKLSQRLVSVKNETAMLTTFNEVNMTPIMEIRKKNIRKSSKKNTMSVWALCHSSRKRLLRLCINFPPR